MNISCDHYWLVRRGGSCQHCKDVFPGNYEASKFERQAVASRTSVQVTAWNSVAGVLVRSDAREGLPMNWRQVTAWADEVECDHLTLEVYAAKAVKPTITARLVRAHADGPLFAQLPRAPVQLDVFLQEWAESSV